MLSDTWASIGELKVSLDSAGDELLNEKSEFALSVNRARGLDQPVVTGGADNL